MMKYMDRRDVIVTVPILQRPEIYCKWVYRLPGVQHWFKCIERPLPAFYNPRARLNINSDYIDSFPLLLLKWVHYSAKMVVKRNLTVSNNGVVEKGCHWFSAFNGYWRLKKGSNESIQHVGFSLWASPFTRCWQSWWKIKRKMGLKTERTIENIMEE